MPDDTTKAPAAATASSSDDGWSFSICTGCGATVDEWLTEEGPDVIEDDRCPMCIEADIEEERLGY